MLKNDSDKCPKPLAKGGGGAAKGLKLRGNDDDKEEKIKSARKLLKTGGDE